jgi:hypothetical protein
MITEEFVPWMMDVEAQVDVEVREIREVVEPPREILKETSKTR